MILTYDAIDEKGRAHHDTVEACDTREAAEQLRRQGLFVTKIDTAVGSGSLVAPARGGGSSSRRASGPHAEGVRLPIRLQVQFTRQMAMLLQSGSGLVPAVTAFRKQMSNPKYAAIFREIVVDLEDGSSLTDALRKHPRSFDAAYAAIVAAGEASASLGDVFKRLSVIVGKRHAMRKRIVGTLAYPALLVVMCSSIINVLLFFVLPRFRAMFEQLAVPVPAFTEFLLSCGDVLRSHWPVIVVGVAASIGAMVLVFVSDRGRQWWSDVQLSVPLFGSLRSRLIQGQIFRTLGMLLENRVGLLEALTLVRSSTRSRRFKQFFESLEQAVTSGGRLSTAFEQSNITAPYIAQVIYTGEESGHLGEAVSFCADNLDESNEELVRALTRLLEPVILIGMGMIVGSVAVSLFMPLFDMTAAM